ncbi:MAG: aminotransferase class V-fold PLP-dependent enzyme [Alteromonadales bacterium]|nr:aminotransferase class V-fold PLP-dependent enzyme [Alteromonadales bacterium]
MDLENYFMPFRKNIIGHELIHKINGQDRAIIYTDWTASGRLYLPIENYITHKLGPYLANTHTETNLTGTTMTQAYHDAQQLIKRHLNANSDDILITNGSGMTAVINKFQRMLGLRVPEKVQKQLLKVQKQLLVDKTQKPVVFITHMEHHSNQTSWAECDVILEVIRSDPNGLPCVNHLSELLNLYQNHKLKIGSFTACSNVTGIKTPYHQLAEIMHSQNGFCFVDFAASAPYVSINMHPADENQQLDAVFFSPHKFLGGPGSSGVLVFNKALYDNSIPDHPGGGTVSWSTPWGTHQYFDDIEVREDGGTPGFLQTIRTALAIKLKDEMGVENILKREQEITNLVMGELAKNKRVKVLEPSVTNRLSIISFYIIDIHYNLVVRMLNDKFGIQTRGGCSCAGTYGHILLNVNQERSLQITKQIDSGDLSQKPGWVRLSFHPTTTNSEALFTVNAIQEITNNISAWKNEYEYIASKGDFEHKVDNTKLSTLSDFAALPLRPPSISGRLMKLLYIISRAGLRIGRFLT